jgi:hypothetical protein
MSGAGPVIPVLEPALAISGEAGSGDPLDTL